VHDPLHLRRSLTLTCPRGKGVWSRLAIRGPCLAERLSRHSLARRRSRTPPCGRRGRSCVAACHPSMAHRAGTHRLWPRAPSRGPGMAGGDLSAVSGLHPRETRAAAASAVRAPPRAAGTLPPERRGPGPAAALRGPHALVLPARGQRRLSSRVVREALRVLLVREPYRLQGGAPDTRRVVRHRPSHVPGIQHELSELPPPPAGSLPRGRRAVKVCAHSRPPQRSRPARPAPAPSRPPDARPDRR
jgi:hypothetical protein